MKSLQEYIDLFRQIYPELSDDKIVAKARATSKKKAEEIASKRAYFVFQSQIDAK